MPCLFVFTYTYTIFFAIYFTSTQNFCARCPKFRWTWNISGPFRAYIHNRYEENFTSFRIFFM